LLDHVLEFAQRSDGNARKPCEEMKKAPPSLGRLSIVNRSTRSLARN
jgi:hypothetical protein